MSVYIFYKGEHRKTDNWLSLSVEKELPPIGTIAFNELTSNWLTVIPIMTDRGWTDLPLHKVPKEIRLMVLLLSGQS
jgi:hypothetical protein